MASTQVKNLSFFAWIYSHRIDLWAKLREGQGQHRAVPSQVICYLHLLPTSVVNSPVYNSPLVRVTACFAA